MVGFSKQVKNMLNHTDFKDCASKTSVATILKTYVTILTEPDLSLQNGIRTISCFNTGLVKKLI